MRHETFQNLRKFFSDVYCEFVKYIMSCFKNEGTERIIGRKDLD